MASGFEVAEPNKAIDQGVEHKPSIFVRVWRGYEHVLGTLVCWASVNSGRLGAFISRRPVLVIVASLILSAFILAGFARFRNADSSVLWVPRTGKTVDEKNYVEATYPQSKPGGSFYAQLAPSRYEEFGGNNAIQIPVTWEMFQLHNKILAVTVNDHDTGKPVTFNDLCYKNVDGGCDLSSGYLWYWYKNFTYFVDSIQGSAADPTAGNQTAFKEQVSKVTYPDGQPVSLLSVFGGTTYSFNPFQLKTAEVIATDYSLDHSVSDDTVDSWNKAVIDLLKAARDNQQYMTYTFITGSSVDQELSNAFAKDLHLVIISLVVYVVVALLLLSRFNIVKTRSSLALLGVFVTALGLVVGWGWGLIFGMPFSPLQELSPFIFLGIGIDVMFILVKSYDIIVQREPWLTLPESFSKLMSTAGLSVIVTLLASTLAFSFGTVDVLASVKWFSGFAALNALMILVLMMTTFVAFMALTEKRIGANRWDCLCCWSRTSAETNRDISTSSTTPVQPAVAWGTPADNANAMDRSPEIMLSDDDIKEESFIKKVFRKYYAPLLAKWWIKVPVILFFVGWAVASWYGIYHIKYGLPIKDLAQDGSYLQDYDNVQEVTYRQQVGEPTNLYFRGFDVSDPAEQYKMYRAWDMALQNEFINASTSAFQSNWLVDFTKWVQDKGQTVVMPQSFGFRGTLIVILVIILLLPVPKRSNAVSICSMCAQVMSDNVTPSPGYYVVVNNCYNPLVGKVTGNLAGVITPTVINGCVPQAQFYTLLDQWLAATGNNNNIIRNADGTISTSKFTMMQTASGDDDKYTSNLMKSIHSLENDINDQLFSQENDAAGTYSVFIYGDNYISYEGDRILPQEALIYFMLALVGIAIVCTIMLVNPIASLLMFVAVGLVVLYLFGELWALHVRFNQISVINMIMAVGLSTDYAVYFAQRFMTTTADGTGNGRMLAALADTGSAVFLGGFTALCGTVPMAFSKSVIIRTFFKLIFGTILFSLMVGLILMPVVFSIIRLPPVKSVLVDSGANKTTARSSIASSSDTEAPKPRQLTVVV